MTFSESKKNQTEKRKKEKLPVDVAPSSEQSLKKFEQVFAEETNETNINTTEPETLSVHKTETLSCTQGVCAALNLVPSSIKATKYLENTHVMECQFLFQMNQGHVLPSV